MYNKIMKNCPLKFINFINICKNFGILYHKSFHSLTFSPFHMKNNKIAMLKNRLADMMNEVFITNHESNKHEYEYMLSGTEQIIYNIASSAIVVMHNKDLLIYDIFADIFYMIYNNEIFMNFVIFNTNHELTTNLHGNLQCDALIFIYARCNFIQNPIINNAKLKSFLI